MLSSSSSSSVVIVTVPKTGLFQDWLEDHPNAAVSVLEDNCLEQDDLLDEFREFDDDEGEGQLLRRDEEEEPDGTGAAVTASTANTLQESKLRLARLVKCSSWNPNVQKIGPYGIARAAGPPVSVRIPELKAVVYQMEDATSLDDLQRFLKYREDGFILIKNVYKGSEVLTNLRRDIVRLIRNDHGLPFDVETMEEQRASLSEQERKRAKKQPKLEKTVRLFPALTDDELPAEGEWIQTVAPGLKVLDSPQLSQVVSSLTNGAAQFHGTALKLDRKYCWSRLRGRLDPRKEWTEYYFFKHNVPPPAEIAKFDRRFAREITKRMENPKPRYGFSAWVAVGPNPVDGGNVALLPGSHQFSGLLSPPKGDETPFEFKKQAKDMPWVVADLEPGDVLLIDMQTTRAFVSNKRSPHFLASFADSMYTLGE